MKRWEVIMVSDDESLHKLLGMGWEPYAATEYYSAVLGSLRHHYLRRVALELCKHQMQGYCEQCDAESRAFR